MELQKEKLTRFIDKNVTKLMDMITAVFDKRNIAYDSYQDYVTVPFSNTVFVNANDSFGLEYEVHTTNESYLITSLVRFSVVLYFYSTVRGVEMELADFHLPDFARGDGKLEKYLDAFVIMREKELINGTIYLFDNSAEIINDNNEETTIMKHVSSKYVGKLYFVFK